MREFTTQSTCRISFVRNTVTGNLLPESYGIDFQKIAEKLSSNGSPEACEPAEDLSYEQKSPGNKKRVVKRGAGYKGKGRFVANSPESGGSRSGKRTKLDGNSNVSDSEVEGSTVPILHCTFDLVFANESFDKDKQENQGQIIEERDFIRAVQTKIEEQLEGGNEDGSTVIDVGAIYPSLYSDFVYASFEDHSSSKKHSQFWNSSVIHLPPVVDDDVIDAHHDFVVGRFKNILAAAYHMQTLNRARFSGLLQLVIPSRTLIDLDTRKLTLTLRATFTVSLRVPNVFNLYTPGRKFHEEEEAQRRLLTYAFGLSYAKASNYRGSTDIPFFLSCLHPAPSFPQKDKELCMQPKDLLPTLLPFQRRSVGWMLSREAKELGMSGEIVDMASDASELPLFWEKIQIVDNQNWYFNRLTGQLTAEQPPKDDFRGGILAEEPGLGKTLESIALAMLNPGIGRNPSVSRYDPVGIIDVKEIKTTLIVTPTSLAQQWIDEIELHAPSLRVYVYEGWTKVPVLITDQEAEIKTNRLVREKRRQHYNPDEHPDEDDDEDEDEDLEVKTEPASREKRETWCEFVQKYDIVITTYTTLQHDLGVARAPHVRPRRQIAKYRENYRDRSPLIMVEWNRVIMDEVQMVGGGKAEEMVSLIPRLSSFAVSGTPARATVGDLIHVINFLRIKSITGYPKAWQRLQKPAFAADFEKLFKQVAVRTMKGKVKDELTIPEQRRYVVPIELGKVEKHVYDQHFEQALAELRIDERGVTANAGWQVDINLLRIWVRRLRAVCTHPQVGRLARQNDRLAKAGQALKTIAEVLQNMQDQNWRTLMDDRKSRVQKSIAQAQFLQHVEENPRRYKEALELLLTALAEMNDIITEINGVIEDHKAKGVLLRQQAAAQQSNKHADSANTETAGRDVATSEDPDDSPTLKTPQLEEWRNKKSALSQRLRENRVILHQIHFLLGDVYHVLGAGYNVNEDEAYGAAENIRRLLLKTTEETAQSSITQVKALVAWSTLTEEDMMIRLGDDIGEKSKELILEAHAITDVLNQQAKLIMEWSARIIKLLTESLSASDDEKADGEEYARTLETQGEAEIYLQEYAALLADRREIFVAERTALALHDPRERKLRNTYAAAKAQQSEAEKAQTMDADEFAPEHEVLRNELTEKRKKLREMVDGRAIKSVFVDLHGVATSISNIRDPERIIASDWSNRLKSLIKEQTNLHDKLDSDMTPFRKAFNDRIEYFRQLQELSDSVRPAEWEGSATDAFELARNEQETIDKSINKHKARQRYLKNLADGQEEEEEDKICILCRGEFTRGFMTHCAHVFCENCLKMWAARPEGKACPVCRVLLVPDQLQRITMESKVEAEEESQPRPKEDIPQSRRVIEYNTIDKSVFEEIQKIDCFGSFGTKIETLVRHLLYLEEVDPGCKSIVFSAWADSLYILERALVQNGIKCLRIDQKKGKENAAKAFKMDDSIRVLLLHGERENAGLNVTCASRVFLTESVVQHSFELQAIARIDRMGQTRPTEVFCYYAENTVEKNILDLAAKRGLSLYTKDHAYGTLQVTSFDMDKEGQSSPNAGIKSNRKQKGQKGDFILKSDDMLAVLFPHLFEDTEYLVPQSEAANGLTLDFDETIHEDATMDYDTLPVAGPSRLS